MPDMRLDLNFVDHPKVKKLIRLAGYEGFYGLLRLFSIAGRMYTDGVLRGCESQDIDDFAEWRKEDPLVDILIEVGFVKKNGTDYEIHDWAEHQPWLYGAEERSEKARAAANARWNKNIEVEEDSDDFSYSDDAGSIQGVCVGDAQCNAGSNALSPSPSPSPSPLPLPLKIDYDTIVKTYNENCKSLPRASKLTDKRRKAIRAVVTEYGEEAVIAALKKVEGYPFLVGSKGWKANFDWLMNKNNLLKVIEGYYDRGMDRHKGSKESYGVDLDAYSSI